MPVYMIYICHSVSDQALLEKYWSSIGPTLERQPIKLLAVYGFEVLEGQNVLGVIVAEWPSMEAAKGLGTTAPGYKAIRHLLADNAKYTGGSVATGRCGLTGSGQADGKG